MSRILSISTWMPFVASLAFIYSSEALRTNGRVLNFVLHRRQSNHQDKANANISLDGGFWFADVTVGDSDTALELLLDTGSADLVLNPGLYTGGPTAVNLQNTFDITYGTTGNSAGSSSQTLTGSIYNDTIQLSSFKLESQTIGVVVSNGSNSSSSSVYPHDGIIGFGDESFSSTNSTPFFHNLCQQNLVEECRFGLALGLNGTGSLTLGGVSDIVPGGEQSLTKVPIIQEWFVTGDLAVGEKIIQSDLIIEFDSGSSAITGPIEAVSDLFNATGIQSVLQHSDSGDILVGYFPCSKPPTAGFSLPSASNISSAASNTTNISLQSKIFNIPAASWSTGPVDAEGKNCSCVISGFDYAKVPGLWVVGQAFFQGKYMDHSLEDGSIGLVDLISSTSNSSSTSSSAPSKPTKVSAGNINAGCTGLLLLLNSLLVIFTVWV